jgi:hypothetical protein
MRKQRYAVFRPVCGTGGYQCKNQKRNACKMPKSITLFHPILPNGRVLSFRHSHRLNEWDSYPRRSRFDDAQGCCNICMKCAVQRSVMRSAVCATGEVSRTAG